MKKCLVYVLWLTLLTVSSLYAHDTYVVKEGDAFVIIHGHDGKSDPYNPNFIKTAQAFDASGKDMAITKKPEESRVLLVTEKDPALVMFVYNTGPRVKTPEGWKNIPKSQAKDVIDSAIWIKSVKQIKQWNDRFGKALGGKMEIVPLSNPLKLKVGDKLAFLVLYDGKPLAGAAVGAKGVPKDTLKTDSNGQAEVIIKESGLNIVTAGKITPTPNSPDADKLGEIATLTFLVN
ncbi:DUF4198 domain-containing protein [Desulfobacca acetoxidans]|uniref:Nickel transport complex protein, NikM subunit, transmembrane n=1 Tax=Desulfobacca acetoxidans (strain ATCC 700848 / DSM 11109 / ASRB2) TaxID=880072 RepID=F2NK13_DESAR|nr:DUF4198 domain-containing protein [Desulfobacca acetoxidans]AEB09957.1 Nickel transport complex protein, NikM subunit, transmembrane [Desulfobacca acetoxidans DSM 11109]